MVRVHHSRTNSELFMLKKSICWKCKWAWNQDHNFVNDSMKKDIKKQFDLKWQNENVECHMVVETPPYFEPAIICIDDIPDECSYLLEQLMK